MAKYRIRKVEFSRTDSSGQEVITYYIPEKKPWWFDKTWVAITYEIYSTEAEAYQAIGISVCVV